jgi:serine/threonine protein phosphatase PrpC
VLHAAGATDKGPFRPVNQDRFAVADADLSVVAVADGIGGHKAGDVAAAVAIAAVVEYLRDRERLGWPFGVDPSLSADGNFVRTAVYLAHLRVLEAAGDCEQYAGMGTTLVAGVVNGARLAVGHVGDSRLYRWSGGRLRPLTKDDAWMSALTNVVGARARTSVHVTEASLADGDTLLLTTDGVHDALGERRLAAMLAEGAGPHETASAIVQASIRAGSRDNCTAVVARYRRTPEAAARTIPAAAHLLDRRSTTVDATDARSATAG